MMRIGLTGGIAAGKSTVSAILRDLGARIVDYDLLAREVVAPGGAALPAIVDAFGPDALDADGALDRAWMAEHVFGRAAEPGARERLDAIEHPLIYQAAARLEDTDAAVVVHDVPLLAEVRDSMPFRFDRIVTVEAPEETRVARMTDTRGMTREQALDRIRHQSTRAEREALADEVIDSCRPLGEMAARVEALYRNWLAANGSH